MKKLVRVNSKVIVAILGLLLLSTSVLMAQKHMFITSSSNEAREQFLNGREQFAKFRFEEAMHYFNKAIHLDPEFALAYVYCAMAEKGGTNFSKNYLEQAIDLKDQVTEGERELILFAKATAENNSLAQNQHINNLVELYPEDERVQTWAGTYYYRNQDYKKALNHLNRAYSENKKYHPAVNLMGYTYMQMGKTNRADKKFKEYISLLPANANPYDSYGDFLLRQGRFTESTRNYQKAIDYNPTYASSYKGLGDNYLFTKKFNQARKNYQKYYEYVINDDNKFYALSLKASVDLHQNNIDAAMNILDKYIQLAEELDKPFYKIYGTSYKGYVLAENGNPDKALSYYKKAMDLVDTEQLGRQMRERLRTTAYMWEFHALASSDEVEKAEILEQKCKNRLAENGSKDQWKMYNTLCGIKEIKKKNYKQAKTHFEEAWDNPLTWYYTGVAWEKEGNERKAQKYYEKVANHYENSIELGTLRQKAVANLKE